MWLEAPSAHQSQLRELPDGLRIEIIKTNLPNMNYYEWTYEHPTMDMDSDMS